MESDSDGKKKKKKCVKLSPISVISWRNLVALGELHRN